MARARALVRYWVYRKFAEFTPCEQPGLGSPMIPRDQMESSSLTHEY